MTPSTLSSINSNTLQFEYSPPEEVKANIGPASPWKDNVIKPPSKSDFDLFGILKSFKDNPMLMGPSPLAVNPLEFITNTARHEKQINLMEAEFLNAIAKDTKVAPIAKKMPDPEESSKEVYQFYIEC